MWKNFLKSCRKSAFNFVIDQAGSNHQNQKLLPLKIKKKHFLQFLVNIKFVVVYITVAKDL